MRRTLLSLAAITLISGTTFGQVVLPPKNGHPQPHPVVAPPVQAQPRPIQLNNVQPPKPAPAPKPIVPAPQPKPVVTQPKPVVTNNAPHPQPKPVVTNNVPHPQPKPVVANNVPHPEPKPVVTNNVPHPEPKPVTMNHQLHPQPKPVVTNNVPHPEPKPVTTNHQPYPEPKPVVTNNKPILPTDLKLHKFSATVALDSSTNTTIAGLAIGSKVGASTKPLFQKIAEGNGGSLSREDLGRLEGELENNTKLSSAERGAIATAIQQIKKNKDKPSDGVANGSDPKPTPNTTTETPPKTTIIKVIKNGPAPVVADQPEPTPVYVPVVVPAEVPTQMPEAPAPVANDVPAIPAVEFGLQVTSLTVDGPATTANLRKGDVIVSLDGKRVQSLNALTRIVAAAEGEIEIAYLDGETGELVETTITPVNGKLGIFAKPVKID